MRGTDGVAAAVPTLEATSDESVLQQLCQGITDTVAMVADLRHRFLCRQKHQKALDCLRFHAMTSRHQEAGSKATIDDTAMSCQPTLITL